jgi:hypothetical protein
MKPADEIESVVKKMSFKAGPEMDKDLWAETSKARDAFQQTILAPSQHHIGRTIMKSPLTKLAAAAIVAIACLIGVSLWRGTQSGIALADVLAQIEKVKAFRCQWSSKDTSEDPNEPYSLELRGTILISQEYGWKTIFEDLDPNGGKSTSELYRLPDKKAMIRIDHKQKEYLREEFDARWGELWWWNSGNDPRNMTKRILECKHESLGRSIVDGVEVEGFRTTDPNYWGSSKDKCEVDIKMWADVKTRLPVRFESKCAYFDKMGEKIIWNSHLVMHDFQWDVLVDAAEFEPVIPDDYTRLVVKFPAITEEAAFQGLKLSAELLGRYPDLDRFRNFFGALRPALEKSETPAALRLKEELKGLSEEDKTQRLSDATLPIRCLVRFYVKLLQFDNKDPAHYGKIVTPKDADKVLMRWKISDNEYRVIYGDLHAETISPEKLAELEKALAK